MPPDTADVPQDAVVQDLGVTDAALPDTGLPDLRPPDQALPDLSTPDQMLPDTLAPDTMPPGCDHPYVNPSCVDGWCLIPAGCFKMSVANPVPCSPHTTREVRITRSFVMAQKETTLGEYEKLTGLNPTGHNVANAPIERISWGEAAYYCNELSSREGFPQCYTCSSKHICAPSGDPYACKGYRLPTEAEWEYAYRAGTDTEFYNGAMTDCNVDPKADVTAWYKDNTLGIAHKTGCTKAPNGWGLCDMAGNVAEMCHDDFQPTAGSTILVDPLGPIVWPGVRGGHFNSPAVGVAAYYRQQTTLTTGSSLFYGFRCMRIL
jgi:formylglycine-generating enzyme required for sulfatase activity